MNDTRPLKALHRKDGRLVAFSCYCSFGANVLSLSTLDSLVGSQIFYLSAYHSFAELLGSVFGHHVPPPAGPIDVPRP